MSKLCRLLGGFFIIAICAGLLSAQVERASILGNATDNSGSALAGVAITVTNEETNTSVHAVTDPAGAFTVLDLIPGSYTVSAALSGFNPVSYRGVLLQVGQQARLDFHLQLGELKQSVEVTATAAMLQTENASVGQVINQTAVSSLPLNGRNFVELAILAPGVTGLDYAQSATIDSGSRPDELRPGGTALEANGASNYSNQVLLDGIDDTEMISHTFVVRPPVEGIQEFKVLTNNTGAEYGRAGGAVVLMTSKSGNNRLAGSLFEYLRNDDLDAKNFFTLAGGPKPPYILNQFGASLGGPVKLPHYNGKDRTFFFMDYEGYREVLGSPVVSTVPTAASRNGNFQGITANGIFDPLTTVPGPNGGANVRTRFPNDIIPAGRFDAIGFAMANLYPLPQTSAIVNNYTSTPVKRSSVHRGDARIDHQASAKNSLFFRYSVDWDSIVMPNTFNNVIGGNEAAFAGPEGVHSHNLVASWTRTFSPTTVGDFRYGYTQYNMALLTSPLSSPVWSMISGRDASNPYEPTAPIIGMTGYAGLGTSRSEPLIRNEHMHETIANISTLRGNHSVRLGTDIHLRGVSETASPPSESLFGRWNFDPTYTSNPAAPSGTGDAIASMILGYPLVMHRDVFLPGTANLTTNEFDFYAKDDWRISKSLTLNLGLHYEINTPFTEAHNYWVNFNPVTGQQLIAGQNGVGPTAGINTDYKAIGPRVAFAWQPANKTVIRGGYGLFYDPQGNAGSNIRQERQPPFDFILNVTETGNDIPSLFTSQGFPIVTTPPPLNQGPALYSLKGVTPDYRNAQVQQFNVSAQREIASGWLMTLGFVGSAGAHLSWAANINLPPPGPGSVNPRRPYAAILPAVTTITWLESSGNSFFSSMQASLERRLRSGLYLLANWTWSHGLDNALSDGGVPGPVPQDPNNRRADWATSNSDIRHRVNIAATYQLPFGPNKPFATGHNLGAKLVRDWQIGEVIVIQSGLPFTVTVPGSPSNTSASSRANPVLGVSPIPAQRSISEWFNPAAFTTPPAYTWGTLGRDSLNGPGLFNLDTMVNRKFVLGEHRDLDFRWELFNAPNHPQFGLPASTVSVGGVATITTTQRPNRQMQFALRLAF
jgi:Carboxypeptidase regulatory-like domain